MVLRRAYAPVLPEMDSFLFARVGEEVDGISLSVLSALAQLGLDPRAEAARLSSLTSKAAANQLARLFARLPDHPWTSPEIRGIAGRLVELLPAAPKPKPGKDDRAASAIRAASAVDWKLSSPAASRHLIWLALALSGALVIGLIAHGYAPDENVPSVSQADPPTPSAPMTR